MRFDFLGEIDSTNDEARRRAENGETGPLWIGARFQSNGRGRRGRAWQAFDGNLFATGLYSLETDATSAANLSFVAAVAVREALSNYIPKEHISLKWPNDVLVNGKKIAGILLESWGAGDKLQIAIGIGVNIKAAPQDDGINACAISQVQIDNIQLPSPESLLLIIGETFQSFLSKWKKNGFAPIRELWLSAAYGINEPMIARLHNTELKGFFRSLNEYGELLLDNGSGEITVISAGDVFFPHLQ